MLKEILRAAKENNRFIGIWIYGENDGFWSGYVHDFTDEFVVIKHYTKFGIYDGLIVERIDNIESIDFEDDYSEGMEYIIANSNLLEKETEIEVQIHEIENWQYEILSPYILNENVMVKLQIARDNTYTGFVKEIDKEFIVLKNIGSNGEDHGKSIYKITDISSVRLNDLECRKRLLLYQWKNI